MFFDSFFLKYIKNLWLRLNVQSIVVGLIIGTVINLFFTLIRDSISWDRVWITLLVSYLITASITNMIALAQCLTGNQFRSRWSVPVIYYSALTLGMIVGTELTFVVASLIFKIPYVPFSHADDLKFNLLIAVVVGTIIYVNHFQKDNYELSLKDKEVQLAKLKELKTKAELQTLQSRINPHFLYNSLNSITSLIHDEPDKAEEMTIKLSKLFRHSLNSRDEIFSRLSEEMEVVDLYMDIEKIRFADKITFKANVDKGLEDNLVPRFILQPLIENALKHGVNKIGGEGILSLVISDLGDSISISVHDNGPAFPNQMSVGYGMQSTYDKLNLLYDDRYELQMNNGAYKEVKIIIPKN